MNANTEVGRSTGRESASGKWEGHRHQEKDTEDREKKEPAGRQSKKQAECEVGQCSLDSKVAGQVNIHSRRGESFPSGPHLSGTCAQLSQPMALFSILLL